MKVGSSALYLFLDGIFGLGLGYVFWVVVSRISGSSVTGETSSSITMAVLFATVFTFGISIGSQRFLGKAFSKKDFEYFREVSKFIILFSLGCMVVVSIGILAFNHVLINIFQISYEMVLIVIAVTISYALVMALRGIFISSLKTKTILFIFIVSNLIRFVMLIPMYFLEFGSEGITLAFASFYLAATILLLVSGRNQIFGSTINKGIHIFSEKRELLKASVAGWSPTAIASIANQSGILFIFGITGASAAGVYYMAFGIFLAISALPQSVLAILFPIMSGMKDGREILLWKAIRSTLYVITPISIAIAFYPAPLLSIFGEDFISGTFLMSLLSLAVLPTVIHLSIVYLSYAYGRYKEVMILGIIPNAVRLILYFLLIGDYGGEGIAASMLVGSLVGLFCAVVINKIRSYGLPSLKILIITGIPIVIALPFYFSELGYYVALPIILFASFLIIPRLGVIKYDDVEEILNSLFNNNKPNKRLLSLVKILFK